MSENATLGQHGQTLQSVSPSRAPYPVHCSCSTSNLGVTYSNFIITTAGSLVRRRIFLLVLFFSYKRASCFTREIFLQTFKPRDGVRARWPVPEPGPRHCCSHLLGGAAAAAQASRRPQASWMLVATSSLSARRDQLRPAVAPHEHRCWCWLGPALRPATGSPPVAGTLSSMRQALRHRPAEKVQLCATAHNWHLHTAHEDGHGSKRRAPARRFHLPPTLGPP